MKIIMHAQNNISAVQHLRIIFISICIFFSAFSEAYCYDIFYTVTIDSPNSHRAVIDMKVSNINENSINVVEYGARQGGYVFINVIAFEAKDEHGNELFINHTEGDDCSSEYDSWEIESSGLSSVYLTYTIQTSKIDCGGGGTYDDFYYSYISEDFAALMPETLFLFPSDTNKIDSLEVKFLLPASWSIICSWENQNSHYNMQMPLDPVGRLYFPTNIGIGHIETIKKEIRNSLVSVATYDNWPEEKKQILAENTWKLYYNLATAWGSWASEPYNVIYIPHSDDDEVIMGGFSEGGVFYSLKDGDPEHFGFWIDLATELVETRYNGYEWGIKAPGWYYGGFAWFYGMKAVCNTYIYVNSSYSLFGMYDIYIDSYVNQGKDLPLIDIENSGDGWFARVKGSLFAYIIARELNLRSDGNYNIDSFSQYLLKKYWGKSDRVDEDTFKFELESFSGIDFTDIFNKYVYGNDTISLDWGLQDDDGDGLINTNEIIWDTSPHNPDTDADGYTDKQEIDAETDPKDRRSCPGPCPVKPISGILSLLFFD